MSAGRFILEDFATPVTSQVQATPQGVATPAADQGEIEARVTASWEKGFKAGWDDCNAAVEADKSRISEAFGRRLSEIDLKTTEVRRAMLAEIEPLFADIFQKILPVLLQQTFQPKLIDEIRTLAEQAGSQTITINVCAEEAPALGALIGAAGDLPPCEVRSDTTLGLSQATICLADSERQFDLAGLLETIERAFQDSTEALKETANG